MLLASSAYPWLSFFQNGNKFSDDCLPDQCLFLFPFKLPDHLSLQFPSAASWIDWRFTSMFPKSSVLSITVYLNFLSKYNFLFLSDFADGLQVTPTSIIFPLRIKFKFLFIISTFSSKFLSPDRICDWLSILPHTGLSVLCWCSYMSHLHLIFFFWLLNFRLSASVTAYVCLSCTDLRW